VRIYTSQLTRQDLFDALPKGVYIDWSVHGSRKRARCFNVALSTDHNHRRPNPGHGFARELIGNYAATWDEWGLFLAVLFAKDPEAIAGVIASADDFAWKTGGHYGDGSADIAYCPNHKWDYVEPGLRTCAKGCGAVQRWRVSS
jgi:hypothetical protein